MEISPQTDSPARDTAATSSTPWLGPLVFIASLGALGWFFAHMAWIEPLTGDGWYNADEAKGGVTWDLLVDQLTHLHNHGNPRIGQAFTLLTYGSRSFHVIATPLVELLLLLVIVTHALGRLPSPRSVRDGAMLLVAAAACFLALPQPGHTFFYRPITTNYLFTLVLSLVFFLPQRLDLRARNVGVAAVSAALLLSLGVGIGKTNEHTGPTMILVAATFAVIALRQGARLDFVWRAAATAGLLIGYLFLFFAPGQGRRYGALGRQSVLTTIVDRGLLGTADLFGEFAGYVGPLLLALCALTIVALLIGPASTTLSAIARAKWTIIGYVALAALLLGTTLAAPKNHYRLFIAPAAMLAIAAVSALYALSEDRRALLVFGTTSAIVCAWTAAIFIPMYTRIHADELARNEIVRAADPKKAVMIPRTRFAKRNSYYYGDSLTADPRHRDRMAALFGVREIRMLAKADDPNVTAEDKSKAAKSKLKQSGKKQPETPPPLAEWPLQEAEP